MRAGEERLFFWTARDNEMDFAAVVLRRAGVPTSWEEVEDTVASTWTDVAGGVEAEAIPDEGRWLLMTVLALWTVVGLYLLLWLYTAVTTAYYKAFQRLHATVRWLLVNIVAPIMILAVLVLFIMVMVAHGPEYGLAILWYVVERVWWVVQTCVIAPVYLVIGSMLAMTDKTAEL